MDLIEPGELLAWDPPTEPVLTVELVPSTCWYSNVRSAVPKEHWDVIRKQAYLMAGHVCEICGGVGSRHPVECHEVWNYDDDDLTQTLVRMTAICPQCHEVKHIGRAMKFGRGRRAMEHLASVNGWLTTDAEIYVSQQFLIWQERSNHKWKLDIRNLHKYIKKTGKVDAW